MSSKNEATRAPSEGSAFCIGPYLVWKHWHGPLGRTGGARTAQPQSGLDWRRDSRSAKSAVTVTTMSTKSEATHALSDGSAFCQPLSRINYSCCT